MNWPRKFIYIIYIIYVSLETIFLGLFVPAFMDDDDEAFERHY